MTVGEIIETMSQFDKDLKVIFTIDCDNDIYGVDDIKATYTNDAVIMTSYDIPTEDGVNALLERLLEENRHHLTDKQIRLLELYQETIG